MKTFWEYCKGVLLTIIILSTGVITIGKFTPLPEQPPPVPLEERIFDYPCSDNSPEVKTAEIRVRKKIEKVKRCQTCHKN
jgi:hypothetical protein